MKKIFVILLALAIAGCGSGSSSLGVKTGSIAAQLDWTANKGSSAIHSAAAPAGVVTVRITVSGPDMTDIQKDFAASAGQGQIDGVPVGTNRTVKAQGLNSDSVVTHEGSIGNVTVNAGQTTDVGTIVMLPLTPQNQGTVSGTVRDTAGAPVSGVTVTLSQQGATVATATTGADGTYSFNVPAGAYTITFSKTGFQTNTSNITIVAGGTLTTDVTAVTTSTLPAGFPTNLPTGNYNITVEVCFPGHPEIPCETGTAFQTGNTGDINQFADSLVSALNAASAQQQTTCSQNGMTCSFSVSATSFNGTSFTITDTITITASDQTQTVVTITFTVTKL